MERALIRALHDEVGALPWSEDPPVRLAERLGTLEAFNTDGLRSLLATSEIPNMKEKTLRYPGHIEKMAVLREAGFFATDPVVVDGREVRPLDVTAQLLFPAWKLEPGEGDLTVMQIIVDGEKDGRRLRYTYDLLDRFDHDLGITSMARTTGYTATMTARAVADGVYTASAGNMAQGGSLPMQFSVSPLGRSPSTHAPQL